MHENRLSSQLETKVGLSRKMLHVKPISIAEPGHELSKRYLRLRVFTAHQRHDLAAFLRCARVHTRDFYHALSAQRKVASTRQLTRALCPWTVAYGERVKPPRRVSTALGEKFFRGRYRPTSRIPSWKVLSALSRFPLRSYLRTRTMIRWPIRIGSRPRAALRDPGQGPTLAHLLQVFPRGGSRYIHAPDTRIPVTQTEDGSSVFLFDRPASGFALRHKRHDAVGGA